MAKNKYMTDLTAEEVDSSNIIKCLNEEGELSILIKNALMKNTSYIYQTDSLLVSLDNVLTLKDQDYYFHIITLKKAEDEDDQFTTLYEYVFKKIDRPILASELLSLLRSIEDLFKVTPERDLDNFQLGVFGELFSIKYLYDLGYKEIIQKYHTNFYSKHDIEINELNRIEIKTTATEKRIHNFKHNQIHRDDVKVYVCSVMIEKAKEGKSLFELFKSLLDIYYDPEAILSLKKLMKRCDVNENKPGVIVSFEKAKNDIKFFDSKDLPQIQESIPNGVTNVSYDVDCSLCEEIKINNMIQKLLTMDK